LSKEFAVSHKVTNRPETKAQVVEPLPLDPVIETYKKDIDVTLLDENLKLTVEQRILNLQSFVEFALELRKAAKTACS